jgi:hypothetical protein
MENLMAKLSTGARKSLPKKDFAGPGRSFPIENKAHARAAIMLSKFAPDPAAVKAKAEAVLGGSAPKMHGNHRKTTGPK